MILTLKNLLKAEEIQRLLEIAATIQFVDGRMSNPHSTVKNNLQPDPDDPLYEESAQIVRQAIFRHAKLRNFCLPVALAAPMLCKYEPGMKYGRHVDAAVLSTQSPMRSDVSCTVFLSPPESYTGGELMIELGDQQIAIKGEAGAAVLYPSTTTHQVKPVTAGQRIVSIMFMQSSIKDPAKRDILFKLTSFINRESSKLDDASKLELEYVHSNLTRMWHGS